MKEKKNEEVIEEVVEVNDQLLNYIMFARECVYQYASFEGLIHLCPESPQHIDEFVLLLFSDNQEQYH